MLFTAESSSLPLLFFSFRSLANLASLAKRTIRNSLNMRGGTPILTVSQTCWHLAVKLQPPDVTISKGNVEKKSMRKAGPWHMYLCAICFLSWMSRVVNGSRYAVIKTIQTSMTKEISTVESMKNTPGTHFVE